MMLTCRYFDNVAHLITGGMHSEFGDKCWISLYRNGVHFKIEAHGIDVKDTSFHAKMKPLIKDNPPNGPRLSSTYLYQRLAKISDLLIEHSLPKLQELAPNRPYWQTLDEYYSSVSYTLKLETHEGTAQARVVAGPEPKAAFNLQLRADNTFGLPLPDLPRHVCSSLTVLDTKHDEPRTSPATVRASGTEVYQTKLCKIGSRNADTGELYEPEMDSIKAYLGLYNVCEATKSAWPAAIPRPQGLIVVAGPQDSQLVAGILLSRDADAISLLEVFSSTDPVLAELRTAQMDNWRQTLSSTVEELHALGFLLDELDGVTQLNSGAVSVHADKLWLSLTLLTRIDPSQDSESVTARKRKDLRAVEDLFKRPGAERSAEV